MNKYRIIPIAISFIIGISVAYFIPFKLPILIITIPIIFLLGSLYLKNADVLRGVAILLASLLFGMYLSSTSITNNRYPFDQSKIKDVILFAKIDNIEINASDKITLYLKTDAIDADNKIFQVKRNVLCNIYDFSINNKELLLNNLSIGNYIKIKGDIERPREARNPGDFDYSNYLKSNGISFIFKSYSAKNVKVLSKNNSFVLNQIYKLRNSISEEIQLKHRPQTAALLNGLLLSDRSNISEEVKNDFSSTGTVHILSVSGLHVAYILLIFQILFGRFNFYLKHILTIVGLLFFMYLSGNVPPVERSVIMAITVIIAIITHRSTNIFNSLAISAIIILAFEPYQITNVGFQLSYIAIISIATLMPIFQTVLEKSKIENIFIKNVILFILLSVAAQVFTIPFTLFYFQKISLISILANVFAVPLSGLIIANGIFFLVISQISNYLANLIALSNDFMTNIMYSVNHYFANYSFSSLTFSNFNVFSAIVVLFFSLFILSFKKFSSIESFIVLTVLIAANMVVYLSLNNSEILDKNRMTYTVFDVGDGHSSLVKFSNGKTLLINCGSQARKTNTSIIPQVLTKLNVDSLDFLAVTNINNNYIGEIFSVFEQKRVRFVILPKYGSEKLSALISYANKMNCKVIEGNWNCFKIDSTSRIYVIPSTTGKSFMLKIADGKSSILTGVPIEVDTLFYKYKDFFRSNIAEVSYNKKGTNIGLIDMLVNPDIKTLSIGQSSINLKTLNTIRNNNNLFSTNIYKCLIFESNGSNFVKKEW